MKGSHVMDRVTFAWTGATPVTNPEVGVRLVLEACYLGNWRDAAGFFSGGAAAWRMSPEPVEEALGAISDGGRADSIRVESIETAGTQAMLRVTTLTGHDPLRSLSWRFERRHLGWVLLEVS